MNLRRLVGISAIALSGLLNTNCKEDIFNLNRPKNMHCPCEAKLRTKRDPGLGTFRLNMGDSHDIVGECGFTYYDNHRGGEGSTLEEIGCDGGVYMKWSYSSLDFIRVKEGWNGETEMGLRIGDTLEVYLEKYPEAIPSWVDGDNCYLAPHFRSYFDGNWKLSEIILVDNDFKSELQVDDVEHICPCEAVLFTEKDENDESHYHPKEIGLGDFKIYSPNSIFPVENCGFEFYCEPKENLGHYNLIGCNGSVYMRWYNNSLMGVSVREGWNGETDRGLRIGDSRERFLKLYPNAEKNDIYEPIHGKLEVYSWRYLKANINESGNVDMLEVIGENSNDYFYHWGEPIEPWQDEPWACEKE